MLPAILPSLLSLLLVFAIYGVLQRRIPPAMNVLQQMFSVVVMAMAMAAAVLQPVALADGRSFDLAGAVLACATLLAGPWVGAIALVTGGVFRIHYLSLEPGVALYGLLLNYLGLLCLPSLVLPSALARFCASLRNGGLMLLAAGFWVALSGPLMMYLPAFVVKGAAPYELVAFSFFGQFLGFSALAGLLLMLGVRVSDAASEAGLPALGEYEANTDYLDSVFQEAPLGVAVLARSGLLLRANQGLCEMLARRPEELPHLLLTQLIHAEDRAQAELAAERLLLGEITSYRQELRFVRSDGALLWASYSLGLLSPVAGLPRCLIGFVENISEKKTYQQQISTLAFQDMLTELPNRRLFLDRLRYAMVRSERSGQHGAILQLDLDNFKVLNDGQGHEVGDSFLQCIALRLRESVRAEDTVARLGGDEFVVILEGLDKDEAKAAKQAEELAGQIRQAIGLPFTFVRKNSMQQFQTTASMGITLFYADAELLEDVLSHADLALHDAKSGGRNKLCFYNAEMQYALEVRAVLQSALFHAQERSELLIYAQPQVDMSGKLMGAELLLRWQHPTVGWVSPAQFIPLAEETGTIVPIGKWVLQGACQMLARWQKMEAFDALTLSVNVSIRQFRDPAFIGEVEAVLAETGAPAERLKLEFTESIVIDDIDDTVAKMNRLRKLGIRFSMDDFGTGYSSLSCLKKLPLDQLKIDQSFIRDMTIDEDDAAIVLAILAISHSMTLEVIAEGVETEQQRQFLQQHGCRLYQGYLFGRPMPLMDLERFLYCR